MKIEKEVLKEVLTEIEAAKYLSLHPTTLRKARMGKDKTLCCHGLPFIKMGKSIRYLKKDLAKYLNDSRTH